MPVTLKTMCVHVPELTCELLYPYGKKSFWINYQKGRIYTLTAVT